MLRSAIVRAARWSVLLLLVAGAVARAQGFEDPDTAAARRHSQRAQLYEQGHFADALAEFEVARRIKPLPALDYDVARCKERLEDWGGAADAYERYLAAAPDASDGPELKARVATLRERERALHPPLPPPPTAKAPSRALRKAAIAVGVLALGSFGAAAGLLGSVAADFPAEQVFCTTHACSDADVAPLRARANAGYALLAVGGAAAVVDVVLWLAGARRRSPRSARAQGWTF